GNDRGIAVVAEEFFGPGGLTAAPEGQNPQYVKTMVDMSSREIAYFVPLILLVVWMGLYPVPILDMLHATVAHLVDQVSTSKLPAAELLAGSEALLDGHHSIGH
ncbi:MAG: hypothetical protein Q9M13_07705, partial [Mariprofundales bacterium]|nr:hypothetical protein [Mariprofundales bacterium]